MDTKNTEFIFELEQVVKLFFPHKDEPDEWRYFTIVARAQFKGMKENRYLLQSEYEDFGLDFSKGMWAEERKIAMV